VYLHRAQSGKERKDSLVTLAAGGESVYGAAGVPPAWPAPNELTPAGQATIWFVLLSMVGAVVAGIVHWIKASQRSHRGTGWSTAVAPAAGRAELDAIRQVDPDFSVLLFEDFVYALYAEAHMARGAGTLERLAPYLRPHVRQHLLARGQLPVSSVIVGALKIAQFVVEPGRFRVAVEIEANLAETPPGHGETAFWVTERWTLSRPQNARSRPPARARVFDCPGCGAPLDKMIGGTCRYCNRAVDTGEYDWIVEHVDLLAIERRGPMLTGTTEEQGTDFPTVVDVHLEPRMAALRARDPAFDQALVQQRVGMIFQTMQHAWTSLEWDRARPFLGDNLFHAQRYWIDAYRRSGLRNVTQRTRILRIDLARVAQDRWFDAITLRVYATGLDYTIRDVDRAVVGGNPARERMYSEYWTLLRGVSASGPTRVQPVCPSCGAALQVNMAGQCGHCSAKVNSGEFDWVLARIEQDEVYAG